MNSAGLPFSCAPMMKSSARRRPAPGLDPVEPVPAGGAGRGGRQAGGVEQRARLAMAAQASRAARRRTRQVGACGRRAPMRPARSDAPGARIGRPPPISWCQRLGHQHVGHAERCVAMPSKSSGMLIAVMPSSAALAIRSRG